MRTLRVDVSGMAKRSHPQREWGWPIAVYLYLAGTGAGAFAVGSVTQLLGHPGISSPALLLWGPLLVGLGAPFLVLDLGKKARFLNACLNPRSSWAARGFLILTSLIVTGSAAFLLAALPDVLPLLGVETPRWLFGQDLLSRVLQSVGLVLSLGTAAYTGVFLKSVKYVSLWNSWLLPLMFLFSALSTGTMALIVVLLSFGLVGADPSLVALSHSLLAPEAAFIVLEGAALAALLLSLKRSGRASQETVRHLAVNSAPSLVTGLVLLALASLAPMPSGTSPWTLYPAFLCLAGAVVLIGGFLLRFEVVMNGKKDAHPLHKMASAMGRWAVEGASSCETGSWIVVPAPSPHVYAVKRLERPMFEIAFSLFVARPRESARAHVQVIAALYRTWRRPLKLEYTVSPESAS